MLTHSRIYTLDEKRAKVTKALAGQLAQNRHLENLRKVGIPELAGMIDCLLDDYGKWSDGEEKALPACYERFENVCFALSIPLLEAAYALYVLRDGLLELASSGRVAMEDEARERVAKFFDLMVVELLRRY